MTDATRKLTTDEMIEAELTSASYVHVLVDAYLKFPTAHNFDLVLAAMREHQTAWMHARSGDRP